MCSVIVLCCFHITRCFVSQKPFTIRISDCSNIESSKSILLPIIRLCVLCIETYCRVWRTWIVQSVYRLAYSSIRGKGKNFLFSIKPRAALRSTPHPIQWVSGTVSSGIKRQWPETLTRLRLLKKFGAILSRSKTSSYHGAKLSPEITISLPL
jgi:hypothetical protein